MKRIALIVFAVALCMVLLPLGVSGENTIDNSALIPPYRDGDAVQLLDGGTPDWLSESIFVEVRAEMCNGCTADEANGTFADMRRVVDHYAEMGVNAVWMTPIADRPSSGDKDYSYYNGYGGFGPHTIAPGLTGTTDYAKGRAELKKLVDYAHSKGVRILVDVVTWGVNFSAPIYNERPELFSGKSKEWSGWAWNWENDETIRFWLDTLTTLVCETGIDGYRCDCEPDYSGYKLFGKVKAACAQRGHKIAVMSEGPAKRQVDGEVVYDLQQAGVNANNGYSPAYGSLNDIFYQHSIVDIVKNGEYVDHPLTWLNKEPLSGYYTFSIACHDNAQPLLKGQDFYAAYAGFFSPFVPLWYIGEEWNNPKQTGGTGVLYFNRIQWDKLETNRAFYERMKQYIRIARTYPELFFYYAEHITDSNICKVEVKNGDIDLVPYVRYADGKAAVILPNSDKLRTVNPTVTVPYKAAGLGAGEYTVTDLLTGKTVAEGSAEKLTTFKAEIAPRTCGVYLVAAKNAPTKPTATTTATTTAKTTADGEPTAPATEKSADTTAPIETEEPIETTAPVDTEEPAETIAPTETEEPTYTEEPAIANKPFPWVWVAVGGGAVIVAMIVLILALRRRKS